jgi:hypothetical protein
MESGSNKKLIIVIVVISILLATSGYFNYQYYKLYKSNKTIVNSYNSNFSAKVLGIGNDSITVDNGLDKPTIKILDTTAFYKVTFTAEGSRDEKIVFSDVKTGQTVNISLNNDNNQLADRIDVMVQNLISGKILNISDEQIEVGLNSETNKIKLSPDTKYYLQKASEYNSATGTSDVNSGLKEYSKDQIKNGQQATIFLTKSVNDGDLQASQVVINE